MLTPEERQLRLALKLIDQAYSILVEVGRVHGQEPRPPLLGDAGWVGDTADGTELYWEGRRKEK
jgi:hypothetical protein